MDIVHVPDPADDDVQDVDTPLAEVHVELIADTVAAKVVSDKDATEPTIVVLLDILD